MAQILIVDPNEEILSDIELILQTNNYQTCTSESVEKAILELRNFTPDLILSETRFDGLTGFDLLEFKQHNKIISGTPFIFLSLANSEQMIRKAMNMGADDFLTKPFAAIDLLLSVKARLHKYSIQNRKTDSSENQPNNGKQGFNISE